MMLQALLDRLGAKPRGGGWSARCPAHDDTNPSLSIGIGRDGKVLLHCFAGCRFAEIVRAVSRDGRLDRAAVRSAARPRRASFRNESAKRLCAAAFARVAENRPADSRTYAWLANRRLNSGAKEVSFGIIGDGMPLPAACSFQGQPWTQTGHRVVCPLFSTANGELVSVQSRSIAAAKEVPKVLCPAGGAARGLVFANRAGQVLLSDAPNQAWQPVVIAEGLTDYLALVGALSPERPVLGVPGTGCASAAIRHWVGGRSVLLALDRDVAGDRATEKMARVAYERGARRVARVPPWPVGTDACDTLRALGPAEFARFLEEVLDGSC